MFDNSISFRCFHLSLVSNILRMYGIFPSPSRNHKEIELNQLSYLILTYAQLRTCCNPDSFHRHFSIINKLLLDQVLHYPVRYFRRKKSLYLVSLMSNKKNGFITCFRYHATDECERCNCTVCNL
jgi:hypothetical protein